MIDAYAVITPWRKSVRSDSGGCVEVALAERAPAAEEARVPVPPAAGGADAAGAVR
ncbi:DUF397 domain-containing protein [Actinomadura parmotrematis]|uniref:DUF397 domain-containing protein n=1 Tax=Actinomadura parmotrematis TaxID=2864039 RepID=A0ABS7FRZ9_9ACTN|nr:DUF397 domain-containing protein [Actinomadura parmotrematis]MBW8482995.1 DUF397 domain-containing protein [Actinomadura parmotrematis]